MMHGLRWVAVLALCAGACLPAPAAAVVTYDLLHDTPRTRELLKEELAASAMGTREQAPAGPPLPGGGAVPGAAAPASGRGDLESIWFAREKYLQLGEAEKAEQQLALLVQTAMQRGVRNLPEYGTVLVREAARRMRSGDFEQAARAVGWARKLAPDELPVHATAALLAFRRNPLNVIPVWDELAAAARAARRSFRLQVWLRANLLGALFAGLTLFFVIAVAVTGAAAAPRFVHDLRETIGFGSPRTRTALAWGVFALPALLGLSPWWWVILGGLALWPYFDVRGRALTGAAAAFLFALPWFVGERAALLTLSERPLLAAIVQVREGNWTAADHATIKAEADRGAAGVPGLTALGLAGLHLGRLDEAEAAIKAGLQAAPSDAVLWNNLGNVAFARQDVAGAIAAYTKAAEIAPRQFAPHRNLSLAYREGFKFAESEAETRLAADIDPDAAAFYAGIDASKLKGVTVDGLPAVAGLWKLAHERADEQEAAVEHLWASLMLGAPIRAWPAVVVVLLAIGGGVGAWRLRRTPAVACQRCGKVFCAQCQTGKRGELCSQCHHIFVKKEGVDARVRVQKMGDIKAHRRVVRIRHLACAALAPGGGHLSAGRFVPGVLFLLPASFLEARALLGLGVFRSPWSLESAASGWLTGAGIAAFAALWALSFWFTLRIEE